MSEPLVTYLEDHAAGAAAAVDLLESLRDHHGEDWKSFAADLLREVEEDQATLKGLLERIDPGPKVVKEAVSRLAEKVSRVKLGRVGGGDLGTFEALETLALGILGKRALWIALAEVRHDDVRLAGMDFESLAGRAQAQHAKAEKKRLEAARKALGVPFVERR
jgi:hypothetical protein